MPALHRFITMGDWSTPCTSLTRKPTEIVRWNRQLKSPCVEWLREEYINTDVRDLTMVWFTDYLGTLGCLLPRAAIHLLSEEYMFGQIKRVLKCRSREVHQYTVHYLMESDEWPCKPCFALLEISDEDLVKVVSVFRRILEEMWSSNEFMITVHKMVDMYATTSEDSRKDKRGNYWVTCIRGAAFASCTDMILFVQGVLDSFLSPVQRACVAIPALIKMRSFPLIGFTNELFDNKKLMWIDPTPIVMPGTERFYEDLTGEDRELAYRLEHIVYLCDSRNHPLCPDKTKPSVHTLARSILSEPDRIPARHFLHMFIDTPSGVFEMPLDRFTEVCDRMFLWNVYRNRRSSTVESWVRAVYNEGHDHPFFTMDVRLKEYNMLFESLFGFVFSIFERKSTGEKFVRFFGERLRLSDEENQRRAEEENSGLITSVGI